MIALLLAALFQSATPASAAATATPVKAVVQTEAKRGGVCRKETVVGSTIKKKICSRPVEARAEADIAEDAQSLPAARDAAAGTPR